VKRILKGSPGHVSLKLLYGDGSLQRLQLLVCVDVGSMVLFIQ
jgi:hypothetical protein